MLARLIFCQSRRPGLPRTYHVPTGKAIEFESDAHRQMIEEGIHLYDTSLAIIAAVERVGTLPYRGFEDVFEREISFFFIYDEQ